MAKTETTFTKSLDMMNIVHLKESINDLLSKESKYIPVASICKSYLKKLDEGLHEEEIVNDFVNELSKVAVHESAKDTLYDLSKILDESKRDLSIVNTLYEMKKGDYSYVVPMIESSLVGYMTDKNSDTRTAARNSLSLFEGIKEINELLESLSFDEYEEKTNKQLHNQTLNESMIPAPEKTYSQSEVDAMLAEAATKSSETKVSKKVADIESHINLDSTIKNILKNNTNESLKAFCEQYTNALNSGKSEEVLYESFISGISRWNYMSAVDTETSALKERIAKYQQDIDLKKILRIMEGTGSYYIVPLIEGVVADYVDNKTMANKSVLKQRLQAFEYDPFVRDILNVVMLDQSIDNTVYLGESVEKINSIVHTEKIFSPVMYVKENECIFNVKGTYYTRKGNTITKLAKSSIENLDESFKTLCNLINHPAVSIDDLSNVISIYEGADAAKVSETSIEINGTPVSVDELNNMAEHSHLMNEHKEGFYAATKMINENFDKIAYIDFVKRLAMNESNGKSVDVFRVKNNLFVNTTDPALGTSTFYRNVNPIRCRLCINEHMEINVSTLFEDILPNQHAILESIEDTKKEYETYIDELNNKKAEFEKLKDESDDTKDIDDAIKVIEDELKDVEKKYEEFQKDSEEYLSVSDTDDAPSDDSTDTTDDADNTNDTPVDASTGEDTETPAQMAEPITNEPTDETTFVDPDQEAIDSATPYDADFDVIAAGDPEKQQIKVLRVSYSTNVKTGKMSNQGTAFVVIPSVDANGDVKDETRTVPFYLDPNRKPILNNSDSMLLSVYNAILDAIQEDPDTAKVEVAGPETPDDPTGTAADLPTDDTLATPVDAVTTPTEDVPTDLPTDTTTVDTLANVPTPEDEPIFGLNPADDPDNIPGDDTGITTTTDDTPVTQDDPATSLTDPTNDPDDLGTDNEIPKGDFIDFDSSVAATTDDVPSDTPAPAVQETPVETEARSEDTEYPIELGLNIEDIKPIKKESFCNACHECGVETAMVEGEDDSVTLKFANKAAVYALKDYFKEWKNFSDTQFINFFPELKRCFENKPSVPVAANESVGVKIVEVEAINESKLYQDSPKGCAKLVLPYSDDYAKLLGTKKATDTSHIEIVTESVDETKDLYAKLNNYAALVGDKIDEDAKAFLDRYAKDFKDISESNVYAINVPYNGFLEQKLESKGIPVTRVDENLSIAVDSTNVKKAKKIFESVYGEKQPVEVRDFFQLAEKSLNEGVIITVEDTKTGKTVKINTDDVDSDSSSKEDKKDDADPFKDDVTTFDTSASTMFDVENGDSDNKDNEDSKDDNSDKDKQTELENNESSDNNEPQQSDSEPNEKTSDNSSDTEEEKKEVKKPKFKFRVTKKHESVAPAVQNKLNEAEEHTDSTVLNENKTTEENTCKQADPNVLDYVEIGDGLTGQIIAKLPMSDNFIVNVGGRTIEVSPKNMKLVNKKLDCVEAPFKFDPATLKALFEQMVHCGLFMNNNQLTPNDCFVNYSEYINAKPEDDIRMVVESEQIFAKKKFVRVTEDVNEFANINEYVEGVEVTATGNELRPILFNFVDYQHATGSASPVRVLVTLESGEKQLINLPVSAIRPTEM